MYEFLTEAILYVGHNKTFLFCNHKRRSSPCVCASFSGNLLALDSNAGNIYILESGIYSVCVSMSIQAEYNSDDDIVGDFELGKFVTTSPCYAHSWLPSGISTQYNVKIMLIDKVQKSLNSQIVCMYIDSALRRNQFQVALITLLYVFNTIP